MSDDNVTLSLVLDNTEALASITQTNQQVDEVVSKWAGARQKIEAQIRSTGRIISSLVSTLRQAITIFGGTIDPWFSALLGAVSSTISTLFAVGVALSATIITSPWAAIVFGAAAGLQIVTLGKVFADLATATAQIEFIKGNVASLQSQVNQFGASF